MLLLDEPTSGMSPAETARMIDLIAALPRNLSVLMIEHDMTVVFSVADRITVLYYGKILATGSPDEIQAERPGARGLSRDGALMLDLENVDAYYSESHILHGVSLAVHKGEVVCLLGRNGAGKTTTIMTVMGYLHPRPGTYRYNGRDIGGLAALRGGAAWIRLRAAGTRVFSQLDRARESDRIRSRWPKRLLDAATGFRAISGSRGAGAQSRLPVVRRRAADAVDRASADA